MKGPALLLVILGLPVLEIYILVRIGEVIGAGPTIGIIIATTVIGSAILRRQGLETLGRLRASMGRGELPAGEMLESAFLKLASILLILPGLITDTIGFLCLVPPLRRLVANRIVNQLVHSGNLTSHTPSGSDSHSPNDDHGQTIEGHYKRRK